MSDFSDLICCSIEQILNALIHDYHSKVADQRTETNGGTDTLSNIEYIQFSDQKAEESKVDVVKHIAVNLVITNSITK